MTTAVVLHCTCNVVCEKLGQYGIACSVFQVTLLVWVVLGFVWAIRYVEP